MPNGRIDAEAVCEFYKGVNDHGIRCEGFMDGMTVCPNFGTKEKYHFWLRTYCQGKCEFCEIYNMLHMYLYGE